jgi:hypothetical protein
MLLLLFSNIWKLGKGWDGLGDKGVDISAYTDGTGVLGFAWRRGCVLD